MSILDWWARRNGYVKPSRRRARIRGYEAAKVNRLSDDAPTSTRHINSEHRMESKILIARARWLHQNDGYIRRALKLIQNNVIGSGGIAIQPRAKNRNADSLDDPLNKEILRAHEQWGMRGVFDRTGRYSSYRALQQQRVVNKIRDGETFTLMTFGAPTPANLFGFWVQLIDPLRIPCGLWRTAANGNEIILGIEYHPNGEPVAYYVQTDSKTAWDYDYNGRHFVRIPAARMVHDFDPEFPEQLRGISGMPGAMRQAPMLDGYNEAALVAAREGASTFGWYKETEDASDDYEGDEDDLDDEDGDFYEEIEPGVIRKLPRGWDLEFHKPTYPNGDHKDFNKVVLRQIASDLNVSYTALANDLEGVNLSSIRHGTQEDREQYKNHQQDQIDTNIAPEFKAWAIAALGNGQIQLGRDPKPIAASDENLERVCAVEYRARGWEFPEPLKDAQANLINLKTRTTSISEIIRKTGRNPEDVFAELESDVTKLKEMGLDFTPEDLQVVIGADLQAQGA